MLYSVLNGNAGNDELRKTYDSESTLLLDRTWL